MKNLYLPLLLSTVLLVSTVARADSYDSDKATIKKGSEKSAKVLLDKKTYVVPVSFEDGASWNNVKDHYELSDASAKCVKGGHAKLTVKADGTVSWRK